MMLARRTPAHRPDPEPGAPVRQTVITVSVAALLDYLTGLRSITNIPVGARIVSIWPSCDWNDGSDSRPALCVRIEHDSLDQVTPGARIPIQRARFRKNVL